MSATHKATPRAVALKEAVEILRSQDEGDYLSWRDDRYGFTLDERQQLDAAYAWVIRNLERLAAEQRKEEGP
jgi:hypothetical protein